MRSTGIAIVAILSIILATACAVSVDDGADAADGDSILLDGVRYKVIDESAKTAGVTALGGTGYTGAVTIKADVNGYKVVSILDSAFKNCTKVTSVVFPLSLKTIGNSAFEGCSGLKTIMVPASEPKIVAIPEGIGTIGENAFKDCVAVKEISIPKTVSDIGSDAFSGCTSLTKIDVSEENGKYSSPGGVLLKINAVDNCEIICYPAAKTGEYSIPGSVKKIPGKAFEGTEIGIIKIPASIETIDNGAFSECRSLSAIVVSDGNAGGYSSDIYGVLYKGTELVQCPGNYSQGTHNIRLGTTAINDFAYKGCSSLTSVVIQDNKLQTVGISAFEGCTSLRTVSIGDSVTGADLTIGDYAFAGCTSLESVSTDAAHNDLKNIGAHSFSMCSKLAVIDLSEVTSMGEGAFKGCTSLPSADLSNLGVVNVSAFEGCESLVTIKLRNAGVDIKASAFRNCESLVMQESIVCSTNSIGDSAFEGCTSLNYIVISITVDASIGVSAFEGCGSLQFARIISAESDADKTVSIGDSAFGDCTQMVSFTFERVSEIGASSFQNCARLEKANLSKATTLGDSSFNGCISMRGLVMKEITIVPAGCFEGCVSLSEVTWEKAASIGDSAFSGCKSLKSIPSKLTGLGKDSFRGCTSLEVVSPDPASSLPSIGDGAFYGCTSIKSVKNIVNVTIIGNEAFYGCISLEDVTAAGVSTVGDSAFDGCSKLTTYLSSAATIGSNAYRNTALASIDMGDTVTSAGSGAFKGCTALASATLSGNSGFISISEGLFEGCTKLAEISIPPNVLSIGSNAFKGCTALSKVTFEHTSDPLPALGTSATPFECGTSSNPVSLKFVVEDGVSSEYLFIDAKYTTVTVGDGTSYMVYYDANGGTGSAPGTSVSSGGTVTLGSASGISRSGFRFMGWSTAPSGNVVQSVAGVTANKTVYAIWEKEYTLTYDKTKGTGTTETQKIIAQEKVNLKSTTSYTREGYVFLGWATTKDSSETVSSITAVAKDMTVYAVWGSAVKVKYDKNGGTGEEYSDSIHKGEAYTLSQYCGYTKAGYMFGGWSKTATGAPITEVDGTADITVYALWTDIQYKVTYKANGGTGTHEADTVAKGATFTLDATTTFAKKGYYFVGWSATTSGETIIKTLNSVSSNKTVYAIWTDTQVTVTYDANGGTGTHEADKVAKGGSITLDLSTSYKRTGYQFSGWSVTPTGALTKSLSDVSADTTVYAVWKVMYTVSFDANGGTGTQSPISATVGSTAQLSKSTTFTAPSGLEFKGWSRAADSTDTVSSVLVSENIVLYAVWNVSTSSESPNQSEDPSEPSSGGWEAPVIVAVPLILIGLVVGLIWYRTGGL